jgi:hypothetical protein
MKADAIDCIRDFVALQQRLCVALREKFHPDSLLLNLPKEGSVSIGDHFWEFQRHGTGVRFVESATGIEVDVHERLDLSDAVDSWRLVTYFESMNRGVLRISDEEFRVDDEGIRCLLVELIMQGELHPISCSHKLLRLEPT